VVARVKSERVGMGVLVLTCHSTCVIIEAQIGARRGSPCTSRSRARARRRRFGASQWTIYSRVRPAFAPLAIGVWVGAPRGGVSYVFSRGAPMYTVGGIHVVFCVFCVLPRV